jgi:hypothetical protein
MKDVEGERVNFFNQVKESVIDFKFYKHIKANRFGKTFLYMFLLLLIAYTMLTAKNFFFLKSQVDQMAYNVPNFELANGRFSFEGQMPYYISNNGYEIFAIDTTGALNESALDHTANGMLVTEDKLYVKNNRQQQSIKFSDIKESRFNKQDLVDLLPALSWMALLFMVLWFGFVLGGHLLYAVILALVGLIISSGYKTDLKFQHVLNFSVYALTLPVLLDLAVDISGLPIPKVSFLMIYTAVAIVYMLFAVKTYSEERHSLL